MKRPILLIPLALTLASSSASAQSAGNRDTRPSFQEQFGVIVERNIFLRDRRGGATPPPPTTAPATQPALTPETSYVLVGIVFEEGENRAYLESRSDGRIVKLVVGDALARGRLAEIAFAAVAYESDSGRQWVEIGQDLTGNAVGAVTGVPSGTVTSGTPAPGAATGTPNPAASSIEERLRQRRLQQGGR